MSSGPDRFSVDLSGHVLDGGRLQVEEKLDEGGMGTVYTATQTSLGRKVIVKVPHVRFLGEPGFRERFAREIKRLIGLEHPHIVSILTQGEHEDVPYFVLQYLAGASLSARLRSSTGGRQTVAEVMDWLPEVAKALDFVHRRDVIHRDVKPANILFDDDDNVFLSDFGIAKALGDGAAEATSLTGTGAGIGSPPYMSPEQGLGRDIDATADQYALAATVYEALGGRPPFEGGTPMEMVMRKALKPPADLSAQVPALPPGVSAAVMKGLEIKPEDRHTGCLAFVEAMHAGLTGGAAPSSEATQPGGTGTGRTQTMPRGVAPSDLPLGRQGDAEQRWRSPGTHAPKRRRSKVALLLMMLVLLGGAVAGLHFGGVVDLAELVRSGPAKQGGADVAKGGAGDPPPPPPPPPTVEPEPDSESVLPPPPLIVKLAFMEMTEGRYLSEREFEAGVVVAELPAGARVLINGVAATPGPADTYAATLIATRDGPWTLTARLEGEGVVAEPVSARVIVDSVAPALTITAPVSAKSLVETGAVVVTGSVSDPSLDRLTVDGTVVVPDASGVFRYELSVAPGQALSFSVVAGDKAGNETTRGPYEVTREREEQNYRITLTAPDAGALLNRRALKVRGRLDPAPATPEARANLVLRVNGERAEVLADGTFDATVTAAGDGQEVIKVQLSGAKRVKPAEVRRSVTIDTEGPTLSVTHPVTATLTIEGASFELRGQVQDASTVTVFADGKAIQSASSGTWRWRTILSEGQTREVKFHAVDAAGNRSAEVTRRVTRRKPTPRAAKVPSWAKVSKAQADEAKRLGIPVAIENKLGMRFVLIPAGTFQMGSTAAERAQVMREDSSAKAEHFSDEHQHSVRLTKAYYMSIYELTNAQYRRFKSAHHSETYKNHSMNGASQPVVNVSHDDVVGYARWLSRQESGRTYRLPTEAEWERACRAETTSRYSWGMSNALGPKFANANDPVTRRNLGYLSDSWPTDDGHRVGAPVGSYRPNPFGLCDMHGNVYEWCSDWYGEDYYQASSARADPAGPNRGTHRVLRGGSWGIKPRDVRCANRYGGVPAARWPYMGCRLVFSAR